MSAPVEIARRPAVGWTTRPAAWVAIAAASMLARLAPGRIRAALEVLRRGAEPASYGQVQAALDAVTAASVLCRGQYCLRRSLAATLLCRMRGTWPTWCTGVRTSPFAAHAWVEAGGRPVGEPPSSRRYRPLITIPPHDKYR